MYLLNRKTTEVKQYSAFIYTKILKCLLNLGFHFTFERHQYCNFQFNTKDNFGGVVSFNMETMDDQSNMADGGT